MEWDTKWIKNDSPYDLEGRGFYFSDKLDSVETRRLLDQGSNPVPSTQENANLISSLCSDGMHRPVLEYFE